MDLIPKIDAITHKNNLIAPGYQACIILGPPGSGKSSWLVGTMLAGLAPIDNLILVTRNYEQQLYKNLLSSDMAKNYGIFGDPNRDISYEFAKKFPKYNHNVVIFDDLLANEIREFVPNWFKSHRHLNTSVFCIAHRLDEISPDILSCANVIAVFGITNQISKLSNYTDLPPKEIKKTMALASTNQWTPMVIFNSSLVQPHARLRIGLDHIPRNNRLKWTKNQDDLNDLNDE